MKEGEFFTFLGPSGCGKTTTLRTITGFIEPAEGSVVVKGRDITRVPIEDRNIGIVFQSYALFPPMTVYGYIACGRWVMSAVGAAGAEVDASKLLYSRLERLHVNVAPRGGEIALDGTVESCEYYGLYIKYYIHVGTQSLKVIEKNDGVNIYDPGQRVKVILNPNDIMAYAPSAEEGE